MPNINKNLHKAKKEKDDNFYTLYEDIAKELIHYEKHFENKVVYCNCDDPRESNFVRYFINNFQKLKLKKLIATCYQKNYNNEIKKGLLLEYSGEKIKDLSELKIQELKGDGDFRSEECIEFLKKADIVVTNPPYSLFRQFIDILFKYNKFFLIVGSLNVVTYKNVFEKIKENKIIIGENTITHFLTNDKKLKHVTSWWLTNIHYNKNYKFLKLNTMSYNLKYNKNIKNNPNAYKKYDNFNAIEVPRYTAIPSDYDGAMGVPITFLEKYNPEQFEIIHFRKGDDGKDLNINGKYLYCRIIIKHKK
jgi:hypothetical protein